MNVLKDVPYQQPGPGRRKLVDEDHMLMMQMALMPGQIVPEHEANSNVRLFLIEGEVKIKLGEREILAVKGDLVPVAYKTRMIIRNPGISPASFLVIKTPHPSGMKKVE